MCWGSLQSSISTDRVQMGTISWSFCCVIEPELSFIEMTVLWMFSCFQQTWNDEIKKLLVLSRIAWGFPVGHEGMDGRGQEQKAVFGRREVASRGTVHQLLLQLQLLCFYFCAVFRLSVLWKQKTSEGLSMYICIKHLLRRSVKKQWLGTNCEAEVLTLFEYIAIILGVKLYIWPLWRRHLCPKDFTVASVLGLLEPMKLNLISKLCPGSSFGSLDLQVKPKKSFCCLKKGKLSHRWFWENQQSYCPALFPPDFLMSNPCEAQSNRKGTKGAWWP